jgi:hypothetical protein
MYLCKDCIPTVFVISPSNSSNNAYTDKIPSQFIRKELCVDWLERLLKRQKNSSGVYINANKLEVLKKLFNRVSDDTTQIIEKSIIRKAHLSIVSIEDSAMAFIQKKKQKVQILSDRDSMLKKLYKTSIRYHKVYLEMRKDLDKSERGALIFLDFNPNVMLILDDCASKDKEIDSELRKNTTMSIFTTAQSATSNFDRASNGYPKHEKLRAKACIEMVFKQDDNDIKHYQKLTYIQNEPDPFRFTIADIRDDFRMGSKPMWDYSDRIKEKKNALNRDNALFDKYVC